MQGDLSGFFADRFFEKGLFLSGVDSTLAGMKDDRFARLARVLVGHSTALKKGERVLIELFDVPDDMSLALIRAVRDAGALPYVQTYSGRVQRELVCGATEEQVRFSAKLELKRMQGMQAYIAIRGAHNIFESSDVPTERMKLASRLMRPVLDHRVKKTRWVVLRWPLSLIHI